jgi:hypothetical protein
LAVDALTAANTVTLWIRLAVAGLTQTQQVLPVTAAAEVDKNDIDP